MNPSAAPLTASAFTRVDRSLTLPEVIAKLGPAARQVGSGLYVLEWDVSDGRVFHVSTQSACATLMAVGFSQPQSGPAMLSVVAEPNPGATKPPKDPLYSGEYFYNFENSYLIAEGNSEAWCINAGQMEQVMLPAKEGQRPWGRSHVVVRGKLGPRGSYGGLGRCKHVLDVTEIVEVSNMRGREE